MREESGERPTPEEAARWRARRRRRAGAVLAALFSSWLVLGGAIWVFIRSLAGAE